MHFTAKAFTLGLALAQASYAFKATILADTNRDGKVDVDDNERSRRGLMIARCSKKYANLTVEDYVDLDSAEVAGCNDASGNVQRNPKYLAPLRTLPVEGLSSNARGSISITDEVSAEKSRVFVKDGADWTFVSSNYTFTKNELENGLKLGIDSRDVRRPHWDGRATVRFTIADGEEEDSDSVALRVAPLLTHHHLQEAERVFAAAPFMNRAQEQFLQELKNNTEQAGIDKEVFELPVYMDQWPQDYFEAGYTSIPGPDGPVALRVLIRSAQDDRFSGLQIFTVLRSDTVGAVQELHTGHTIDATGNLEAIPPHSHDGNEYPAGRIIMGSWGDDEPLIIPFLRAQEVQEPLILDTIWLYIGHVDEFLQFLPADNDRGWVLMADDPLAGLELLQKASDDGHGDKRTFSRPRHDYDYGLCVPHLSIDEQLAVGHFKDANEKAARHIEGNIEILRNATGLTDEEIFRVPSTFHFIDKYVDPCEANNSTATASKRTATRKALDHAESIRSKSMKNRRQEQAPADQVVAHHPATINGVVLSDSFYLAPNPWGPVIDGKDIIAEAVRAAYAKANYEVTFQDDWSSHHYSHGEIHCGTNTWRNADAPWW